MDVVVPCWDFSNRITSSQAVYRANKNGIIVFTYKILIVGPENGISV